MSKLEEIEKAVSQLSPDQLDQFRAWFEVFDAEWFDAKIERDAQSGRLDKLAAEAVEDFRSGRAREI